MNPRTADSHSEQGNTDLTELIVIDAMSTCKVGKEHNEKRKPFLHKKSAGILGRTDKHVERNNGDGKDTWERQ